MLRPEPKPPAHVRLTRLGLSNFRNYTAAQLSAGRDHVVLFGPNGAGKTNVLEGISLLSPGRGLRRATYKAMVRQGAPFETGWAVSARIDKAGEETAIGTGLQGEGSRIVRVNGADARPDDLTGIARILWLTPAMDGLFTGGTSDRRRFLDRLALALHPYHGRRASAYERAMRQRNKMFEDGVNDPNWYEAVEREMAEHGSAMAAARLDLVIKLNAAQAVRAATGGDFPQALLGLSGDEGDADGPAFLRRLREGRGRDRGAGRSLSGPHRVDLSVTHVEKDMPASLASTGEQKALLIGIVLGHAALVTRVTNETPILLLDEVAAHLDPGRRAALYDTLEGLGAQTFMTGTDDSLFTALGNRADRFRVEAGAITPAG
ncbi:DNA replication/repair protein RecF [Acuticoccus yangtzensis]|uniref:DNA replication/repair protein RecF n=1 Tax=Acuticoccus yangtzensis TaxID=1443441 RepID=UPI000AC9259A|nr:DNA replication/repair protein RecF [Acuticoccus yangtzensis]